MDDTKESDLSLDSLLKTPVAELVEILEARACRWPRADDDNDDDYELIRLNERQGIQWLLVGSETISQVRDEIFRLRRSYGFERINIRSFNRPRYGWDSAGQPNRPERCCTIFEGCAQARLLIVSTTCEHDYERMVVTVAASADAYAEVRSDCQVPLRRAGDNDETPPDDEGLSSDDIEYFRRIDQQRTALIALLTSAAREVRDDIRETSRHLMSVVPTPFPSPTYGFSSEVPKIAHLRALFWTKLHASDELACELDWTVYGVGSRGIESVGDVALAGSKRVVHTRYSAAVPRIPELPRLLLEFERVWLQVDDANPPLTWSRVASRVDGVRRVLAALAMAKHHTRLAGVVVATFGADSFDMRRAVETLAASSDMHGTRLVNLWEDRAPTLLTPSGQSGEVNIRDTYVRFDLFEVVNTPQNSGQT